MPRRPKSLSKLDYYGVVDTGASDPSIGEQGELYYNTTSSELKIWLSGVWTAIGGSTGDLATYDFMDGSDFLFMDGTGFDFMDA